jgi:hypothetical protein
MQARTGVSCHRGAFLLHVPHWVLTRRPQENEEVEEALLATVGRQTAAPERHKAATTFSTGQPKELRAATNAAQVCTMEKLGLAFYAKQILNI